MIKVQKADAEKGMEQAIVSLSIVVPCFNEEAVLPELIRRVSAVAETCVGSSWELILVDDGSTDRTRDMITELAETKLNIRAIILSRNHGHQKALSAGLTYVRGTNILVLDADLQDPPELLPDMLELMQDGADVVYGQRRQRAGETVAKRTTAAAFYRLLDQLTDVDIPLDTGDFRLMSRTVVDYLNTMPEEDRFIRGMVSWLGFRQIPLPYDRAERFAGETKYPFKKMLRLAVDAITGFSIVPLRLATWLALLTTVLGLTLIVWVLFQWFTGDVVSGWSSVMVVVLLVSSVQLLTIGILGEYIGRLYLQSKRRPHFVVERVVSGPDEHS
ncbi:glycosyltransferase family 2 protein [Ruegeria sp. YS9]|uniref:glycosyltransferase family 2 protein n=1 Tax=Ruegeria sp. YS9 TaxID=2966453 RepID=UPI00214AF69D|nr:glycosyltransferase family 2 protein [Ruegeria sp. YS9]UUV08653.1 glycosyltransferase family 2 protein [Ruegeria sp. YS9]